MRSVARRRVRKSRGEQAVSRRAKSNGARLTFLRTIWISARSRRTAEGGRPSVPVLNWEERASVLAVFLATCDCKQTRALVWEERAGGDLAIEGGGPASRNLFGAARTPAFCRQAVLLNEIAVAADQGLLAVRAMSVFAVADHCMEICGIDIA